MLKSYCDFGSANHGVQWAASLVPQGYDVTLDRFGAAPRTDDYAIRYGGNGNIRVLADTPVAAICSLLELGQAISLGERRSVTGT